MIYFTLFLPLIVLIVKEIVARLPPPDGYIFKTLREAQEAAVLLATKIGRRMLVWRVVPNFVVRAWGDGAPENASKVPVYAASPEGASPDPKWSAYLDRIEADRIHEKLKEATPKPKRRKKAGLSSKVG